MHRSPLHATSQQPPGDLGLPIIGETLAVAADGDAFGPTRVARHGAVYKTNILGTPTVMVHQGDAVNTILASEQDAEVRPMHHPSCSPACTHLERRWYGRPPPQHW